MRLRPPSSSVLPFPFVSTRLTDPQGAQEAYARLTRKSTIASPGFSRNNRAAFPPNSVSTLLLQSSKHSAIATLSHSVVRSTSSPPDKLLRQWAHVRPEGERLEDFSDEERKSLPLGLRTLLGQYWVRDLTVSALFTDAAIVSGETGQLTLLLAGSCSASSFDHTNETYRGGGCTRTKRYHGQGTRRKGAIGE